MTIYLTEPGKYINKSVIHTAQTSISCYRLDCVG